MPYLKIIKLNKKVCASKDIIKKVKGQSIKWGKMFSSQISDKGLVFTIHKEHVKLNNEKTNNPTEKIGRILEWTFLQKRYANDQTAHELKTVLKQIL